MRLGEIRFSLHRGTVVDDSLLEIPLFRQCPSELVSGGDIGRIGAQHGAKHGDGVIGFPDLIEGKSQVHHHAEIRWLQCKLAHSAR